MLMIARAQKACDATEFHEWCKKLSAEQCKHSGLVDLATRVAKGRSSSPWGAGEGVCNVIPSARHEHPSSSYLHI
jgi:hypothetical protein